MSIRHLGAVLLLVEGLARIWAGQADERQVGAVRVLMVSRSGDSLPAGRLTIETDRGTVVFTGTPKGEVTVRLPFGRYRVSFLHEMMMPTEKEVDVNKKATLVVLPIDFQLVHVDPPVADLSVRIRRSESCSDAESPRGWVRLVGVFSDVSLVAEVKSGHALFESLKPGAYVAIVVSGTATLSAMPVSVRGKYTTLEVPITACP